MKNRTAANHSIVITFFILGASVVVIGVSVMFGLITPGASGEARALGMLLALISWVLSWVLRGLYISNRDLSIEDMGEISLKTYIGICQEVYTKKYGGGK